MEMIESPLLKNQVAPSGLGDARLDEAGAWDASEPLPFELPGTWQPVKRVGTYFAAFVVPIYTLYLVVESAVPFSTDPDNFHVDMGLVLLWTTCLMYPSLASTMLLMMSTHKASLEVIYYELMRHGVLMRWKRRSVYKSKAWLLFVGFGALSVFYMYKQDQLSDDEHFGKNASIIGLQTLQMVMFYFGTLWVADSNLITLNDFVNGEPDVAVKALSNFVHVEENHVRHLACQVFAKQAEFLKKNPCAGCATAYGCPTEELKQFQEENKIDLDAWRVELARLVQSGEELPVPAWKHRWLWPYKLLQLKKQLPVSLRPKGKALMILVAIGSMVFGIVQTVVSIQRSSEADWSGTTGTGTGTGGGGN